MLHRRPGYSAVGSVSPEVIAAWEDARLKALRAVLIYARGHKSDGVFPQAELDNAIGLEDWGLVYGPDEVDPVNHPSFGDELLELMGIVIGVAETRLSDYEDKIHTVGHQAISLEDMIAELEKIFKPEIDQRSQIANLAYQELHNEVLPAIEELKCLAKTLDSPQAIAQLKERYTQLTQRLIDLRQIFATTEEELIAIKGAIARHGSHFMETVVKVETGAHQTVESISALSYLNRWKRVGPTFVRRWSSRLRLAQERIQIPPWWQVLEGRVRSAAIDAYYLVRRSLLETVWKLDSRTRRLYQALFNLSWLNRASDSKQTSIPDQKPESLAKKLLLEALSKRGTAQFQHTSPGNHTIVSTPKASPTYPKSHSGIEEAEILYQDLLGKVLGDKETVARLIEYERKRKSTASREELLRNAIVRWEQDNR